MIGGCSMLSKKIALIPAYEPTVNMISLLKELKNHNFEIIIINDGSGKRYNDFFW